MLFHLEILGIPVVHLLLGSSDTEGVEEIEAEEPDDNTFGFVLPPQVEA